MKLSSHVRLVVFGASVLDPSLAAALHWSEALAFRTAYLIFIFGIVVIFLAAVVDLCIDDVKQGELKRQATGDWPENQYPHGTPKAVDEIHQAFMRDEIGQVELDRRIGNVIRGRPAITGNSEALQLQARETLRKNAEARKASQDWLSVIDEQRKSRKEALLAQVDEQSRIRYEKTRQQRRRQWLHWVELDFVHPEKMSQEDIEGWRQQGYILPGEYQLKQTTPEQILKRLTEIDREAASRTLNAEERAEWNRLQDALDNLFPRVAPLAVERELTPYFYKSVKPGEGMKVRNTCR